MTRMSSRFLIKFLFRIIKNYNFKRSPQVMLGMVLVEFVVSVCLDSPLCFQLNSLSVARLMSHPQLDRATLAWFSSAPISPSFFMRESKSGLGYFAPA